MAAALGCDIRTVAKWEDEGLPVAVRGKGGRPSLYDLEECLAWQAAREQLAAEDGTVTDLKAARARKEHWQAMLAEQMHQIRAKDLLPRVEVQQRWAAEIGAARAVILQSYTASADRVLRAAVRDGLAGVERELKGIAFEVLRELSSGAPSAKRKGRPAA